MVQGLAFLSKKNFNPQNQSNRKRVWEAQESAKQERERVRKREAQFKREKEDEELEKSMQGTIGGCQAQLRFMYDAPPGLTKTNDNSKEDDNDKKPPAQSTANDDPSSLNRLTQASTGNDAAAAAFRRMMAASVQSQNGSDSQAVDGKDKSSAAEPSFKFAPVLQGSSVEAIPQGGNAKGKSNAGGANMDNRSALEKAVGRKDRSSQNLSYEQQIERFPQLKNAPMVHSMKKAASGADDGDAAASAPMMVNFKPLGAQILHVRCLACGIWGHQRGDRECAKSGWNPFALPSQAKTEPDNANARGTGSSCILPDATSHKASSIINDSKRSSQSRKGHSNDKSDSGKERRRHSRHRHSSKKHRRRKHRDDRSRSSDDDTSASGRSYPSSEDSHVLKRRKDHDYSDDDSDDNSKKESHNYERKRGHKSSKKKKRKHERSDSSRRKRKRHKHSGGSYDSE